MAQPPELIRVGSKARSTQEGLIAALGIATIEAIGRKIEAAGNGNTAATEHRARVRVGLFALRIDAGEVLEKLAVVVQLEAGGARTLGAEIEKVVWRTRDCGGCEQIASVPVIRGRDSKRQVGPDGPCCSCHLDRSSR